MGPREAAALVAREADAGIATALGASDAARVLIPESVVARVASVPAGAALEDVVWQVEVHLRVQRVTAADLASAAPASHPSPLASLPVGVLRGAGPVWSHRLADAGVATVGELASATSEQVVELARRCGAHAAVLAGCAGIAAQPWPRMPAEARGWGSVLDVARADPSGLSGDRVLARTAWALALELVAVVDAAPLSTLSLARR